MEFRSVHGVYKPGHVKLKPAILKEGQEAVEKKYGREAHFDLVFHGGSGSSIDEIHETLDYGVIKMNIDTDTQYTFTRPIVDHMLKNYDGVLKVEGEVGNKKKYDPRSYLKLAEEAMAQRVCLISPMMSQTRLSGWMVFLAAFSRSVIFSFFSLEEYF